MRPTYQSWIIAVALTLLLPLTSFAGTIPDGSHYLSDLIDGSATLESGDKRIADISYTAVGTMPDAKQVVVSPIIDFEGNYGFRFTGPFIDLDDGLASDAFIEFTVQVTDPTQQIVGLTLQGNPSVLGGSGVASITETVLPQETGISLDIFETIPGSFVGLDTTALSTGYTELRIQKDILLMAGAGATATVSFFDQTFAQEAVPEPASADLLVGGVGIMLLTRRRRRR